MRISLAVVLMMLYSLSVIAQDTTATQYRKRVLEQTELDLLGSYYSQTGENASVTGGRGTEELTNYPVHIVVSIPVGMDNILAIDAGISAYSSASSSNLNPFDGKGPADPFVASTGASQSDHLMSIGLSFTNYSKDRNHVIGLKASTADEHDYVSLGFGGSYTRYFNHKNTSVGISADVYLDNWKVLYPYELGGPGGDPEEGEVPPFALEDFAVSGNQEYRPLFTAFDDTKRSTYALGFSASQVFSKRLQGSLNVDLVKQQGLLSNHMQRVYFQDIENTYIDNFHLAEDVERLPDSRFKVAIGGRLNYYVNEYVVAKGYYRYYFDDWGVKSHTIKLDVPVKTPIRGLTLTPSYRFYTQTAVDYFAPYDEHLSSSEYYTSDYDLAQFNAHQVGLGLSFTDVFNTVGVGRMRFKSIDLSYDRYWRDTGLQADILTLGVKFQFNKKKKKEKRLY